MPPRKKPVSKAALRKQIAKLDKDMKKLKSRLDSDSSDSDSSDSDSSDSDSESSDSDSD